MKSNSLNSYAYIIVAIRWLTLLNAFVLLFVWPSLQLFLVFCIIVSYNLILSAAWERTSDLIRRYPKLAAIDLTLAAISLWFTGATWKSPYYPYLILSLVIAIFFLGFKKGLFALLYTICLYTAGILGNGRVFHEMIRQDNAILLFSSYLGIVLVAVFFGFPASIVRTMERKREEIKNVENNITYTKNLIHSIEDGRIELSIREIEILDKLSRGKSNKQIAGELRLSENTIKNHLYRIYKKIGINSRTAAIIYYHSLISKNGIRNDDEETKDNGQ
jgi:DNA-binding CsgD family transcriptional regulator